MIGAALGYQVELVIPENAGEKRRIAETFGARVILTDAFGRVGWRHRGSPGALQEIPRTLFHAGSIQQSQ